MCFDGAPRHLTRMHIPEHFYPAVSKWRWAWLIVALSTITPQLFAQTEQQPNSIVVDFSFEAPAECPDEEQAFLLVHRRSERVVRGEAREASQKLAMRVLHDGTTYRGVLTVTRAGAGDETRSMTGENCSEVVEALTLTAALSIDPNATLTIGSGDINGESGASTQATTPPDRADQATREDDSPGGAAGRRAARDAEAERTNNRLRPSLGVDFNVARVMDNAIHLGAGAVLALSRGRGTRWFPLEARFSLSTGFDTGSDAEPRVKTQLFLGRLSYCPLRLGGAVALLFCPLGEAGVIAGRSLGVEDESNVTRFYAALGIELWFRAQLSHHWNLWLSPALSFPLTERSFGIDPGPEILASTVTVAWNIPAGLAYVF